MKLIASVLDNIHFILVFSRRRKISGKVIGACESKRKSTQEGDEGGELY